MRAQIVAVGAVVVMLSGCSAGGGTSARALSASESPSQSASATATAEPPAVLPKGYIRLADRSGFVSLGVPHGWYHAGLDGSDPELTRLEKVNGRVGRRWHSFAKSTNDGGVLAAADPLTTDAVLLIERDVGVDFDDLGKLDRELRPELAKAGDVRSSAPIRIDGKRGLQYHLDYRDSGAVVHEVIDFFDVDGTIADFTFTGAAASVAAVTATIHFHSH